MWHAVPIQKKHEYSGKPPQYSKTRDQQIFQQENARPFTAMVSTRFLHDLQVIILCWPARSPDLSPIWKSMEPDKNIG